MQRRKEIIIAYGANLIQGFALNVYPAISLILTDSDSYGFSYQEYGNIYIPLSLAAILFCFLNPLLIRIGGLKGVFISGLILDICGIGLLPLSSYLHPHYPLDHIVVFISALLVGVGFGLLVPAVNIMAMNLFPDHINKAILALNGSSGLGTALSPLLLSFFLHYGSWEFFPTIITLSFTIFLLFSKAIEFTSSSEKERFKMHHGPIPSKWWLFAAFTLIYGILETIIGNWGGIYFQKELGISMSLAVLGLTLFWTCITAGRLLMSGFLKPEWTEAIYYLLPLFIAFSCGIFWFAFFGSQTIGYLSFCLAGIGCSALLPLTISLSSSQLPSIRTSIPGWIFGLYLTGYGIGGFGVGSLIQHFYFSFPKIFFIALILSLLLMILSFLSRKPQKRES